MSQDNPSFKLDDNEPEVDELETQAEADYDDAYASSERYEEDKARLIDFLQYPREKRKLTEFLEETYKQYEEENVDRTIQRVIHEHQSELKGSTPFYRPGHIGPLMYEYLNMIGVESAFVSGLQHTKSSMTKSVQQRVDEINTLLRGVGGFNRQIKASFSRSAVVYLEAEDPDHRHREKVVFTVNLGDYELRYPMDETAEQQMVEDGRTLRRMVWDEAVNTLAEIVSNTGLKPKYVKNDKNSCAFTMRQLLLSDSDKEPDEFFTFGLKHMSEEQRDEAVAHYEAKIAEYEAEIAHWCKKRDAWWTGHKKAKLYEEKANKVTKQRDFYIGTTPDPREMDTGLIFSIAVNTLKDHTVTKDKMQVIMTKYILALSNIAVDKSMDQQVSNVYQHSQGKVRDFQHMQDDIASAEQPPAPRRRAPGGQKKTVVYKDDLVKKRKKASGGGFKL